MKIVASRSFKTVNQKFQPGDEVPDNLDFEIWDSFVELETSDYENN